MKYDVIIFDSDRYVIRVEADSAEQAMEIIQAVEDEGESLRDDEFGAGEPRIIHRLWCNGDHNYEGVEEVKE